MPRHNLRHAGREMENDNNNHPRERKMTNSTSYCALPHFLNSSSRVREESGKNLIIFFKRIKSAGDRDGRNCSLDREFYARHKWHEQSNLQPREILMRDISATGKGAAEIRTYLFNISYPCPENVNDSGIAQLQRLKDASRAATQQPYYHYFWHFSTPCF